MPRKPALPTAAQRVDLLEEVIEDLVPLLHEQTSQLVPGLRKVPLEVWTLHTGASFFYVVAHSITNFVKPEQFAGFEPAYRALLGDFAAQFGDLQGEIGGLQRAVLRMRDQAPGDRGETDYVEDVIIQTGLWPLRRSLKWKKLPAKHTPVVAVLGNLLWSNGASWFDPDEDPSEAYVGSEVDVQMAVLETMQRMARDEERGFGFMEPA